jgi:type VI secretion system secreted protein VgrG
MADLELKNRSIILEGSYSPKPVMFKNARVTEGLSQVTEITVEFLSSKQDIDIGDFVGKTMSIAIDDADEEKRYFSGTCVSVEHIGVYQGMAHFVAEVRSWLWMLNRTRENRIFQDKSVLDIITEVIGDYGFSSDVKKKTTATYKKREYCVQYRETDFDFISRLMEEEGIYYFFIQDEKKEKMVLADSVSAHEPNKEKDVEFHYREANYRRRADHVFEWNEAARITTGKVTIDDYDFEKPKSDLKAVNAIPKGKHSYKSYEDYDYPGHIRTAGTGDTVARVRMESLAVKHAVSRGVCNVRTFGVGQTFKLKEHPRKANNDEYLIIQATHHLQIETDYEDDETSLPLIDNRIPVDERNKDTYRCFFDVIPKKVPFRAPQVTEWPEIVGMQTAMVTGPSGDEIYTDKYGRIKVQFHWDRLGKKDEKTTCFVRCVMPWTGKNWGMISIPRIGQEVAIQFEEGDPDRPVCTGMLYNADTMPPYTLPGNMTQTGIKTRSSKSGGTDNFNELVFEDKKDAEFVRMQSEKDYTQIIKNNAEIFIGLEKKDEGNLTQTIHNHKIETLKEGDHVFTVEKGNEEIFIKTDRTDVVEGKSTQTITGDTTQTVTEGNFEQTIEQGNHTHTISTGDYSQTVETGDSTREVSSGDDTHTISMGDMTVDVSSGSVSITAGVEICLTVGGNSITIDNSGITIAGTMITVEGDATVDIGSPATTVAADGILTLDGGTTMIN